MKCREKYFSQWRASTTQWCLRDQRITKIGIPSNPVFIGVSSHPFDVAFYNEGCYPLAGGILFSLGNEDRGGEYFDVSSMNLLFDNHRINNSPSKIDQWCKPKPAAKLVLALVRRSPLMLKERVGGSMTSSYSIVAREVPQC